MGRHDETRVEFDRAVQVFVRAAQTRLICHICTSLASDPTYVLRNRSSIERVMRSVMNLQGIDSRSLRDSALIEIIRVAGTELKIKVGDERWKMY